MSISKSPLSPGELLEDKYRIVREIGAGAMGVVVEAKHLDLGQRVAIKFLHPQFARDEKGIERFRREARAAARVQSEHVVQVLDVGRLDKKRIPFIVMEFLEGWDLDEELRRRGSLPLGEAVQYLTQACEALTEAHAQGIVHRDLKPANLFLQRHRGDTRRIKVLDFGISKISAAGCEEVSLTDTATLMGSPAYMAPEQLESARDADARSDIWSLGVILHELVSGELPFDGSGVPQRAQALLTGTRIRLDSLHPELSPLEKIVARCLATDRNERFASARELSDALMQLDRPSVLVGAGAARAAETERPPEPVGTRSGTTWPGLSTDLSSANTQQPVATGAQERSDTPNGGAWAASRGSRSSSLRRAAVLVGVAAVAVSSLYWVTGQKVERSDEVLSQDGPPPLSSEATKTRAVAPAGSPPRPELVPDPPSPRADQTLESASHQGSPEAVSSVASLRPVVKKEALPPAPSPRPRRVAPRRAPRAATPAPQATTTPKTAAATEPSGSEPPRRSFAAARGGAPDLEGPAASSETENEPASRRFRPGPARIPDHGGRE